MADFHLLPSWEQGKVESLQREIFMKWNLPARYASQWKDWMVEKCILGFRGLLEPTGQMSATPSRFTSLTTNQVHSVERIRQNIMFTFGWKEEHNFVEFSRWAVDKKRKSFQNENFKRMMNQRLRKAKNKQKFKNKQNFKRWYAMKNNNYMK